jgi:dihydrofolate reductase
MRKVVAYVMVSLDGVAESPDQFFGWDEVLDAAMAELIATQDAVILGRRSYDEWAPFWPGSDIEPFATFINGTTKYVATSTPLAADWSNSTEITGDLVEFVQDLKSRPGGDIGIHASISVAQALLAGGVVDELGLAIAPRIVGTGRRLLEGLPPIELEPIRTERTPAGHLLVTYRVTREALSGGTAQRSDVAGGRDETPAEQGPRSVVGTGVDPVTYRFSGDRSAD